MSKRIISQIKKGLDKIDKNLDVVNDTLLEVINSVNDLEEETKEKNLP